MRYSVAVMAALLATLSSGCGATHMHGSLGTRADHHEALSIVGLDATSEAAGSFQQRRHHRRNEKYAMRLHVVVEIAQHFDQ